MAIGVTAPLVLARLLRHPDYAASRGFVGWNLLGILDLTVAVSIGALVSLFVPSLFGTVTSVPMTQLPLVLIPAYLVPTFLMLHLTALWQARRMKDRRRPPWIATHDHSLELWQEKVWPTANTLKVEGDWSGRADLNCRPLAPQASALPG